MDDIRPVPSGSGPLAQATLQLRSSPRLLRGPIVDEAANKDWPLSAVDFFKVDLGEVVGVDAVNGTRGAVSEELFLARILEPTPIVAPISRAIVGARPAGPRGKENNIRLS